MKRKEWRSERRRPRLTMRIGVRNSGHRVFILEISTDLDMLNNINIGKKYLE